MASRRQAIFLSRVGELRHDCYLVYRSSSAHVGEDDEVHDALHEHRVQAVRDDLRTKANGKKQVDAGTITSVTGTKREPDVVVLSLWSEETVPLPMVERRRLVTATVAKALSQAKQMGAKDAFLGVPSSKYLPFVSSLPAVVRGILQFFESTEPDGTVRNVVLESDEDQEVWEARALLGIEGDGITFSVKEDVLKAIDYLESARDGAEELQEEEEDVAYVEELFEEEQTDVPRTSRKRTLIECKCHEKDCDYVTQRPDIFVRHMKMKHRHTESQLAALRKELNAESKRMKMERTRFDPHECPHCNLRYKERRTLTQHIRTRHSDLVKTPTRVAAPKSVSCPLDECGFVCETREKLANHCAQEHATGEEEYIVRDYYFATEKKFQEWKAAIELDSKATFSAESRTQKAVYYWCSRGKRQVLSVRARVSTTNIAQTHCSAFMTAYREDNGHLRVRACTDHIGHDCDPSKIPLPSACVNIIKDLINKGNGAPEIKKKLERYGEGHPLFYVTERAIRDRITRMKPKA